jgi:hypothetical protein
VYEFRETIERYIGLTLTDQSNAAGKPRRGRRVSPRRANVSNVELGAICLKRRNRNKLSLHQTEARKDFLFLTDQLLKAGSDEENLEQSAIKLVSILKDFDAQNELEKMFARSEGRRQAHQCRKNGE